MNNKKKHWSHDSEPDLDNPNRFDGRTNAGISWSPETFEAQRVIGEKKAKVEMLKLALEKQVDESAKVLISHEQRIANAEDALGSEKDADQRERLQGALDNHTAAHDESKTIEGDKVAKAQAAYDSAEDDLFEAARTRDKLEAVDVDAAKKLATGA